MNLTQIENKLKNLVEYFNQFEFIYDLLSAYNLPKASITRLKKGNLNLSKNQDEIIWKKKLFFREEQMMDLHESISIIEKNHKHNERFIIVTDYKTFLAIDTKTGDRLDIEFKDLAKHYDFFLPWSGMEKTQHANENPADVKAAERMAKLFDAIKQNNPDDSEEFAHSLNVFLSRLLFCFFAEDTNIFEENQFTNAISSHTQADGTDLDEYLETLFEVLDTPQNKRNNLPSYLEAFPYVNGGLFKDKLKVPKLNKKSRQSIIASGELNWSDINPDIFGSMFQAVIDVDQRGSLGQHYTSVPNIMKVIEPLFLNELKDEFEIAKGNKNKLNDLLKRLQRIKLFDPACGSGNFLIIAYKELRRLEIEILDDLKKIQGDAGTVSLDFGADYLSHISLNNFYGIELDDFAHEIAKLALWLAEHQMNLEFFKTIGQSNPTLPLKDAGQIYQGNACRLSWTDVCPISNDDEAYIFGNPPYLGYKGWDKSQKEDMSIVFKGMGNVKRLDYIACWFKKASDYIVNQNASYAFVSTNSIVQGEQVSLIWPYILSMGLEIGFAHSSFKWTNNAKAQAGVSVVVIGIQNNGFRKKYLFIDRNVREVNNINPYLISGANIYITQRKNCLSDFPEMALGSSGIDGNNLILSTEDKISFIEEDERSKRFIRNYIGGNDFLNSTERFCLWIEDSEVDEAMEIRPIKERIINCKEYRENGGRDAKKAANVPHRFFYRKYKDGPPIVIPFTSSENREYLPVGFANDGTIISNGLLTIYDYQPYLFSILCSKMHWIWTQVVSGKLETRIRYSVNLVYNTFPFPKISSAKKQELTQSALSIVEIRQKYSEKTLAELYAKGKMPQDLQSAHIQNDVLVERCYKITPFNTDEERLEYLFSQYAKMVEEEKNSSTLFAEQRKSRKKK